MMNNIVADRLPLAPISFLADKVSEKEKRYLTEDSGIVKDTSTLYVRPDALNSILNSVLGSIRRKSAFEQICTEYPSLRKAALNMVSYFTHLTPAEGSLPLLTKALATGIDEFMSAHQTSYMSNNPSIKIRAFILGSSSTFHEILFNSIYGKYEDAWVQWKPLTEPIYEWVSRYQFKQLLIVPTSSNLDAKQYNAASNKLLFEVFDFSDLSFCGISSAPDKIVATG